MCVVQDWLKEIEEEGQISYKDFKICCVYFFETVLSTYKNSILFLAPFQSVDWMSLMKVSVWNNIVSLKWLSQILLWLKNCLMNILV